MEKMIDNTIALEQYYDVLGEGAKGFIVEIIESFLLDAPNQFDLLDRSLAENNPANFQRAAHTLKTTCLTIGATQYAENFLWLEERGASGDLSGVASLLNKSKDKYSMLKNELYEKYSL